MKVKDIEVNEVYNVISYSPNDNKDTIDEISTSIVVKVGEEFVEFIDVEIVQSNPDSRLGFEWTYNDDDSLLKLEYLGNKETHPEYFL